MIRLIFENFGNLLALAIFVVSDFHFYIFMNFFFFCSASCDQIGKITAHAIYSTVFRKHDRCYLQVFPGAAAS